MQVAIIGLGYMGRTHLEAYKKMDGVTVVAGVDAHMPEGFSFPVYKDVATLMAKHKLDMVDICLPTPAHADNAVYALEKGAHVFVEKPLALTLEDADKILEASRRTGKQLMVGHVCRFQWEYRRTKKILDQGTLGKILTFTASRNSSTPQWSHGNWLGNEADSGGTMMDLQIHDIDIANWFFGKPSGFACYQKTADNRAGGFADVLSILDYPSGVQARIEANHLLPDQYPFSRYFKIVGEKGVLEFQNGAHLHFQMMTRSTIHNMEGQYRKKAKDDPYYLELSHFVESCRNGTDICMLPEEARLAVDTVLNLRAVRAI